MLISKYNNVMQTIVKDTYRGTHDMEKGMCSTSFYKKWGDEIFQDIRRCLEKIRKKEKSSRPNTAAGKISPRRC